MASFFASDAPLTSDLVLVFEIAIGAALILGMFLVRRGHVRTHMYLQSSMILVNIPIVLLWMIPPYLEYVLPGVPQELGQVAYWLPTLMLVAGGVAEALGVYIILVAATSLVPERFRFRNYKLVMRSELALWWVVLLTGISTYYVFFAGA
jgi:uncharacterized membrane protein YozB (DUF420 family)